MIQGVFKNVLTVVLLLVVIPSFAQKKTKRSKQAIDTATIYHDFFKGTLPEGRDSVITFLQLDHKLYHDEGSFNLDENYKKHGTKSPTIKTQGFWTVLRGTAEDEDATVVELDGDETIVFYLRRNDSTLQRIDATLNIMEPADAYLLHRVAGKPVPIKPATLESDKTMVRLVGTYKGKLACADCSSITSTLTLQYRGYSKMGTYQLSDKYIGTRNGDIVNERHGRWSYQTDATAKTTIVVLDNDRRGHEKWFMVKKDGNIIQLDQNKQKVEAPVDQTLWKQ